MKQNLQNDIGDIQIAVAALTGYIAGIHPAIPEPMRTGLIARANLLTEILGVPPIMQETMEKNL